MEQKAENDSWILREIENKNMIFKWGSIQSICNLREASSYIVIAYYETIQGR